MTLQPESVYRLWTARNRRAAAAAHGWTDDTEARRLMTMNRAAHSAHNKGERSAWAVEGERAYQAARYSLRKVRG